MKWISYMCVFVYIGEGNGNPLQYSCLENPRDRQAWWAAVYGVAQSRTRLKRLSSSSSSSLGQRSRKQNLLFFKLAKCFLRSDHTHERSQSTLLLNSKVVCESPTQRLWVPSSVWAALTERRSLVAEPADVCLSQFWRLRSPRSRCRFLLRALPGLHTAAFWLCSHAESERTLVFLPLKRTPVPSWEPCLHDLTKPTSQRPHR